MAFEGEQIRLTGVTASADLSAKQFYFVKMSGEKTVTVCAATTDKPVGVLQNTPTSGQAATVCAIGQTKISGDADLNYGDSIGTSVDGEAAAYTASDTTKYIVGQVIEGNTTAHGLVTAFVSCPSARTLA